MTVSLRYYQEAAISAALASWDSDEERQPLIVLPTGAGKTITALSLVAKALDAGERVLWIAHRTELIEQPLAALVKMRPDLSRYAGIVQAKRNDSACRAIFASKDTLNSKKRRDAILAHGPIDLLVIDEAHHSPAAIYARTIRAIKPGRMLGLTATPYRDDGVALDDFWEIASAYPMTTAIADGFLVPPMASVLQIEGVDPKKLAECDDEAAGELLIANHIVEHTVEALQRTHIATELPGRGNQRVIDAVGRRWFIFSASVRQAELTADALNAAGIKAAWASGETPAEIRSQMLLDLSKGRITALVSPMIFTEGTDCPAVDAVFLARACASWATYVQCVGRGLRLYPGKTDCLVIDCSGATKAHDLRAAPVLLGGSKCPEALDGVHDFVRTDKGRALCKACKKNLACFELLGPHAWDSTNHCKACKVPKCDPSPTKDHKWQRTGDTRVCTHCGHEMKVKGGGVPKVPTDRVDARWVTLPWLDREVWAVRAREFGMLLNVVDRPAGVGEAYWIRHGGTKARKLTPGPVPLTELDAWCSGLLLMADKLLASDADWRSRRMTIGMARYCEQVGLDPTRFPTAGKASDEITRKVGRDRALSSGIAVESKTQKWWAGTSK